MGDPYNLQRFIEAQDPGYRKIIIELKTGQKYGHWMWYIFPQIEGLGESAMSRRYAIASRAEAEAYLEHPLLGLRLRECTQLVLNVEGHSIGHIFHYPDDLKFRSCMTLFEDASRDGDVFRDALLKYFGGIPDQLTLDILKKRY